MKKVIILFLFAIVSYVSFGQIDFKNQNVLSRPSEGTLQNKGGSGQWRPINSKYVLVYKSEALSFYSGLTPKYGTSLQAVVETFPKETIYSECSILFDSVSEVIEFLNSSIGFIEENNIIGIYDLTTAKRVKVKLKIEKKSQPRQVIIEEKTWEEKEYVIDNR